MSDLRKALYGCSPFRSLRLIFLFFVYLVYFVVSLCCLCFLLLKFFRLGGMLRTCIQGSPVEDCPTQFDRHLDPLGLWLR